jgi:uncharacterized protein involved in outer membrane biogenesis
MSYVRKILLTIFILLLVFFIAAYYCFDLPQLKEKLTQQAYQLTGYQLAIRGKIHWCLSPRLAICTENVVVANSEPSNSKPWMQAESVKFYPEFFPLFVGHLNISEVSIRGLTLSLKKTRFYYPHAEIAGDLKLQGTLSVDHEKKLFSFSGDLQSPALLIGSLLFKNVHTTVDIKKNLILLYPLTANLYEGDYRGQVLIDNNGTQPKMTLNGTLTHADANLFFKSILYQPQVPFSGILNMGMAISFVPGQLEKQWNTLNGNIKLQVEKGVLYGVNLPVLVELGQALVGGSQLPRISQIHQTNFSDLHGSFQIRHGVLSNEDFMLHANPLVVTGHGRVDLNRKLVDYNLMGVVDHEKNVPIHIYGPFNNLNVDTEALHFNEKVLMNKAKQLHLKIKTKLKELHLENLFK